MKILGIDPGKATGWAILQFELNDRTSVVEFGQGEVQEKYFNEWLDAVIPTIDFVVAEDFIINPHVKAWANTTSKINNTDTAKLIGRIQYACHLHMKSLSLQPPSDKPFAYTLIGLQYVQGKKKQHANDAKAHARLWLRKEFRL